MRDIVLSATLMVLLALAAGRPFVGVLVWSWISFMNPHREGWGFATTMPWAMLAFLVTLFGYLASREPKRLPLNAVTVLIGLFAVWITITSLAGIGPPDTRWTLWDRVIKILAGLLLTAALLTDRQRIDAMVWLMAMAIGFYGVKGGIFTLVTGGSFIVLGPPESPIADRNHLAVAMLVSLPLMNYLRLQARHRVVRLCLVFAMATTLIAAVGSQSRGALVAIAATATVFWLRSNGKITSGLVICAALAAAFAFMPDTWVERMRSIQNYEEDGSAMGRLTIWRAALMLGLARPHLGGGFRAIYSQGIVDMVAPGVKARATHSIWLEVLADHGFPGFFLWLGIFAAGVWYSMRMVRLGRDRPELRWAYDLGRMSQVSVVAYATGGTFLSLSYWDVIATLMVVLAAAHSVVVAATSREARPAEPRLGWRAVPAGSLRPAGDRA